MDDRAKNPQLQEQGDLHMTGTASTTATSLRLGGVTLRNRLVSAPMERNYCDTEGRVTDVYVDYLVARARAGVALLMTEATYVRQDGKGRTNQLGAHDDACIPGLRRLADAIHAEGALIGCEINHGGRTAQSTLTGQESIAPSPIPCVVAGGEVPREMTREDIRAVISAYGDAAERCEAAGIDVISIHAGHGYLIHQFMSHAYNKRTDEFADPTLFLNLVISEVRRRAPRTTVGMRLSLLEGPADALTAEQTFEVVRASDYHVLDFLDLSAGNYEAGEWIVQSGEWKPGVLAEYAERYRQLGIPLGLAGRLNNPEVIERILQDGVADFVSLARALHADPLFATACLDGRKTRYRPCIACNVCSDSLGEGPTVCAVNPEVGRGRVPLSLPSVRRDHRVLVVGAGPAGITAARYLAKAGAMVRLVDEREAIGGDMRSAAGMRATPDFHRFIDWGVEELEALGVRTDLSHRLDTQEIVNASADSVVMATGGRAVRPAIPGIEQARVHDAREWTRREGGAAASPEQCTILGADSVGMVIADTLASSGTRVLLVGEEATIAPDSGRRAKILAVPRLEHADNVEIHLGAVVEQVSDDAIVITTRSGERLRLPAPGPILISLGTEAAPDAVGEASARSSLPITPAGSINGSAATAIRHAVVDGYDVALSLAMELAGEERASVR